MSQLAYWDGVGATKTFTHPVNFTWLAEVSPNARILDYGCGYGRVMAELHERGFRELLGVDLSPALIARGRQLRPDLRLEVLDSPPTVAHAPASFDVVVLFAVLTCVPDDDAQRALIAELVRVLAPGGLLYLSDMLLQDDEHNQAAIPRTPSSSAPRTACSPPETGRCAGITTSPSCGPA